jgi:hypothetical protein
LSWFILVALVTSASAGDLKVEETAEEIRFATPELEGTVKKRGYVSGIAGGSFVDKKSGFRDVGFGLDIVDWIMEPGSDKEYRDQLDKELVYQYDNAYHGKTPKRSIEGPQICTRAKELKPKAIRGKDFLAVTMDFTYRTAAPDKKTGSVWTQTIVFPHGKRYFISCDKVTSVNASPAMFQRIDMPGHIKHTRGDTFSEIYLSYYAQTNGPARYSDGRIPSSEFFSDFAPDEKFNYRRESAKKLPERFIRAYRLRDPKTGKEGPWLAGMTLDPAAVYEAWCHQRGYVCLIEEYGGRPIKPGESFSAAFIVGYFDSIDEMHRVYDDHKGHTGLEASEASWRLTK